MAKVVLQCRPSSHPFNEREIFLTVPVKIGRAVAGCKPSVDNGYFNCKVLSRNHAVLWYEDGKFFLQDTQSSNGTFVNSQKLPTAPAPSATSSQTGQGTLKEDPKNEGKKEIFSGDVVQFGVEVLEQAKKGAPPVTHGCIVANLKLFHPDGSEAKASPSKFTVVQNPSEGAKRDDEFPMEAPKLSIQELYELQTVLQEAHHRELVLESKLSALNKILAAMEQKDSWSATFQEDLLLSKIQYLQGRLRVYESQPPPPSLVGDKAAVGSRSGVADSDAAQHQSSAVISDGAVASPPPYEEDAPKTFLAHVRAASLISDDYKLSLITEWKNVLEERSTFELVAKDALQKALADKLTVVKALAMSEERLYLAQNECDDLSNLCQCTQKDLLQLVEKFTLQSRNLDELTQTYQESERVKLECLDALRSDKQKLEEQLSEMQEKLERLEDLCEKLRRQYEMVLRKFDTSNGAWAEHINGDLKNGVHGPNDGDQLQRLRSPEGDSGGSDDDLLPQYADVDARDAVRDSIPGVVNQSRENIFHGKDVAQLLKDMRAMDSDDEDVAPGEETNLFSNSVRDGDFTAHLSGGQMTEQSSFPVRSRLRNDFHDPDDISTRISFEALPTVDMLKSGRSPCRTQETLLASSDGTADLEDKNDGAIDQLLEGNERLTELVTSLQAELIAERENVRRLTAARLLEPPPSVAFEHGDSASLHHERLPSTASTTSGSESSGKDASASAQLDSTVFEDQRNNLIAALDELNELSSVFQPTNVSTVWASYDPVAIGVLLLLFVWLCSVVSFGL